MKLNSPTIAHIDYTIYFYDVFLFEVLRYVSRITFWVHHITRLIEFVTIVDILSRGLGLLF